MTTITLPANFNGKTPKIDPANAAMLLIDHQSGLFQTIGDMPMPPAGGCHSHSFSCLRFPP